MTTKIATPGRIRLTIWALVAIFVAALIAAIAALNWSMRERALSDADTQVRHFASGAVAAMNRALLGVDVMLASTDDLLGLSRTQGQAFDSVQSSTMLRSVARQNLLVRYVAVLDLDGNVLASSDPSGQRLAVELPPIFLQRLQREVAFTLLVSAPSVSFTSSERVVYFARHLHVQGGQPLLAVAQVPVSMLLPVMMQSVDIPGLEVTCERRNGELILGAPLSMGAVSAWLAPPLYEIEERSDWSRQTRLTQQAALVVAHSTIYPDLWISASLPKATVLQASSAMRYGMIAAGGVIIVMLLASGLLMQSYVLRISEARRATLEAKAALDQALGTMVSGFLVLDADYRVVQWNKRYEEICSWLKPLLVPGVPFRTLLEHTARVHLPHGSKEAINDWLERRMQMRDEAGSTHEQRLPMGMVVQITQREIPGGGAVITCHDVTELRRASEEAESLAFYDPLTGLPNRRLLLDRLAQAVGQAGRYKRNGALLFLDLDHFKLINDTRGHDVGDQLLQQVSARLTAAVRSSDTVARLGGDEFVVLLPMLSDDKDELILQVRRVGEKILHALALPYDLGGQTYRGAGSIGATLFRNGQESVAELLRQADIAMYQAKSMRGNALAFFDPQMQAEINQRAQWESELQVALAEDQFELYYQPQVTEQRRVVGIEALLRWRHPQRGIVAPNEFISVAEDCGLIVPIGHWVLRTACEQLARWQNEPMCRHLHLSVNVSARQFRQSDFADVVIGELRRAGAPAHLLKLELTESLVIEDVDDSIAKMHQLRARGVRFSVDDFGTGYSSLAYLTRLPLQQLKIDRSFVSNLGIRASDDAIVQTIIGMARTLGLEVIAEGVETELQRSFLVAHQCDLYQGFLFGEPLPYDAFLATLTTQEPAKDCDTSIA